MWYRWKWKLMMMVMMMMMRNLKIRQVELDTMRQTCSQQRSWLPKSTKTTFESWFRGCHKIEFKESLVYQESQFNTVFIWYTWRETPLKALADPGEGRGGPGPPLSQSLKTPAPLIWRSGSPTGRYAITLKWLPPFWRIQSSTWRLFHCILPMHLGAFLHAVLVAKMSSFSVIS